jgi:hypothetical protein
MIYKKKITTEVEFEVEFPCYRKSRVHHWKIISDKEAICVTDNETIQIGEYASGSAFASFSEPSDEQTFKQAFIETLNKIKTYDTI